MNTIVLDTNTYTAFLKSDNIVVQYIREADQIIMPYIVLGELYYGFFKGRKSDENLKVLDNFLRSPRVKIVHSDSDICVVFGEIAAELTAIGKPMQQDDIWIAAICKKINAPLLTYDRGFSNIIGLRLLPI